MFLKPWLSIVLDMCCARALEEWIINKFVYIYFLKINILRNIKVLIYFTLTSHKYIIYKIFNINILDIYKNIYIV